jgi:hypothetical protein
MTRATLKGGGVGKLRPERGSSEVMIGTAHATPEEFTAIGTEGVIFPTPFEVTRKAMTIHVHPARRASLRLRHGCLPGSPAAISPRAATLRFPPLFADAIRRGGSIRGPESTQGRRASPRPVVRYRARPDAKPVVCCMRSDHRPEVRCRRCTKRPRHRLQ